MPVSFSDYFHVSPELVEKLGFYDVVMDVDARVFVRR